MVIEILYGILVKFLHNNKWFCWFSHKNNKSASPIDGGLDCNLMQRRALK